MPNEGGLQRPERPLSIALWNFSSNWFLIPQGTGIICVLLYRLDYQFDGLRTIAKIVWIYTIVLFAVCLILYTLRILVYPKHVRHQLRVNIVETSCLPCIPIAYTAIIELAVLQYGSRASLALYVLWWIQAGLAMIACLGIPYVQLKLQPPGISHLPPTILLPFIAALTSAAGGGVLCRFDHIGPRLQVPVIIISYLQIGAGLSLAAGFDTLILLQHFDRFTPTADNVYQDMIVCGPFGQGAFALQVLGQAVMNGSFANYDRGSFITSNAAAPIGYTSQFLGLLTWGYGIFWWCFAILSICHTLCAQPGGWRKTRFSMAAWSLIFPWVRCSSPTAGCWCRA
jgi:tellurite resistance protein TehA-like permease